MAEIICRCSDGTEYKISEVHQIEMHIGDETFFVCPYGDDVRVVANKRINIEQSLNGVTVRIAGK